MSKLQIIATWSNVHISAEGAVAMVIAIALLSGAAVAGLLVLAF